MVLSRVVSKHRTIVTLCVILVGSLVSITANLKTSRVLDTGSSLLSYGLYHIQKGVSALQRVAADMFGMVLAIGTAHEENDRLRTTIEALFPAVVRVHELEKENERLRELLGFAQETDLRFKPVELIGKDATNWFSTVVIDKGTQDGLRENLCAATAKGVVGRILSVEPLTARVLLLTDSNSRIGAIVQRTRAQGIVEGDDRGACIMKYLDPMADVERGDLVVTSGDSLIFPKGLAIGEITEIERGHGELLKWAKVKPTARISQLEEVFVILP